MPYVCKGICKVIAGVKKRAYFRDGKWRWCKVCKVSWPIEKDAELALCPCCYSPLRSRPRTPKARIKFLMAVEPKIAELYKK